MRPSSIGVIGIFILVCLALSLAVPAPPPKKVATIGVLMPWSRPSVPDWKQRSAFLQELRTLGWREGENLVVEYRWASGRLERGAALAAELVRLPVDVMVVGPMPSVIRVVQQATTTIPIVMISSDDPVAEGFIASLARPGGNITGVDNSFVPELSEKLLELLKEAVPAVTRMAVFASPTYAKLGQMVDETTRAAQALGVQLHVL